MIAAPPSPPAPRVAGRARVDPAFIAAVVCLRPACSIDDMAAILGCDRKRVLTVLQRLGALGLPSRRRAGAVRFRPLTATQQAEITMLHHNGRGLDFYAVCRVVQDAHPLAIHLFLRHSVGPRAWWVRPCLRCEAPLATSGAGGTRHCPDTCAPPVAQTAP